MGLFYFCDISYTLLPILKMWELIKFSAIGSAVGGRLTGWELVCDALTNLISRVYECQAWSLIRFATGSPSGIKCN